MKRETKETRNVYDYTMYETVIANVSRLSLSGIPKADMKSSNSY